MKGKPFGATVPLKEIRFLKKETMDILKLSEIHLLIILYPFVTPIAYLNLARQSPLIKDYVEKS